MPGNGSQGLAEAPAAALHNLVGGALHQLRLDQLTATTGAAGSLGVNRISVGNATIDEVVIRNLSTTIDTGRVTLRDVQVILTVEVGVKLSAFGRSRTFSRGIPFRFSIPDSQVPQLDNMQFEIPAATLNDNEIDVEPVTNLDLGGASFEGVRAQDTRLPAAGFGLVGLGFQGLRVRDVEAPAVTVGSLDVDRMQLNSDLVLPTSQVNNIELPRAQVPSASSLSPLNILGARPIDPPFDRNILSIGIASVGLVVNARMDMRIGSLEMTEIEASSSIESVRLANIRAPVTLEGLSLGDLRLDQVRINQISA